MAAHEPSSRSRGALVSTAISGSKSSPSQGHIQFLTVDREEAYNFSAVSPALMISYLKIFLGKYRSHSAVGAGKITFQSTYLFVLTTVTSFTLLFWDIFVGRMILIKKQSCSPKQCVPLRQNQHDQVLSAHSCRGGTCQTIRSCG